MVLDGYGYTRTSLKFNNKELDVMHWLNVYDSQARIYDLNYDGFWTADPLAEKYYSISPYAYCGGNPLSNVDPDGRDYGLTFDDKTKTVTISATYYTTSSSLTYAKTVGKDIKWSKWKLYIYCWLGGTHLQHILWKSMLKLLNE